MQYLRKNRCKEVAVTARAVSLSCEPDAVSMEQAFDNRERCFMRWAQKRIFYKGLPAGTAGDVVQIVNFAPVANRLTTVRAYNVNLGHVISLLTVNPVR